MGTRVVNTGDADYRAPGTSDQTGNHAPKFPWRYLEAGRVAKVAGLCCAYHLGYTDDRMSSLHELPPAADIYRLFVRLLPWFPGVYDRHRARSAARSGYTGPLEPFNAADIENRVRYCFATPGSRAHTVTPRLYGISREHPRATEQQYHMRIVWVACSTEVMRRLALGIEVERHEATIWGKLPEKVQ